MAKNKKRKKRHPSVESASSVIATSGDEPEGELAGTGGEGDAPANGNYVEHLPAMSSSGGQGFFAIYKPGQGYYTRMSTAAGAGLIVIFGAHYIYTRCSPDQVWSQMGIPAAFLAVMGTLLYWIAGSGRKTNDFFIATEGEMKKVSWSSKNEVVGSTKVVLIFTLMMATMLFVVDGLFMAFFGWIGVLKTDILKMLFGF